MLWVNTCPMCMSLKMIFLRVSIQCQNVSVQAVNCNYKSSNVFLVRWTMLTFCMVFNKNRNKEFLKQPWLFFLRWFCFSIDPDLFIPFYLNIFDFFNYHRHLNSFELVLQICSSYFWSVEQFYCHRSSCILWKQTRKTLSPADFSFHFCISEMFPMI